MGTFVEQASAYIRCSRNCSSGPIVATASIAWQQLVVESPVKMGVAGALQSATTLHNSQTQFVYLSAVDWVCTGGLTAQSYTTTSRTRNNRKGILFFCFTPPSQLPTCRAVALPWKCQRAAPLGCATTDALLCWKHGWGITDPYTCPATKGDKDKYNKFWSSIKGKCRSKRTPLA